MNYMYNNLSHSFLRVRSLSAAALSSAPGTFPRAMALSKRSRVTHQMAERQSNSSSVQEDVKSEVEILNIQLPMKLTI
jgi:hypothetical protein